MESKNQQDGNGSQINSSSSSRFSEIAQEHDPSESSDSCHSTNATPENIKEPPSNATSVNNENGEPANETAGENVRQSKHTRKRKLDPTKWARNVRKIAKMHGQSYISTKGVKQPEKKIKPPCVCRRQCYEKFSQEDRENIFKEFYKLSGEAQNQQIASSVQEYPKQTVRLRQGNRADDSRRSFSRMYFLNKGTERIQVCQTMYLNTFDFTLMKVRVIVEKKRKNNGVCPEDGRGKHGHQKRTSEVDKQRLMDHIGRFPAYFGHFLDHFQKRSI